MYSSVASETQQWEQAEPLLKVRLSKNNTATRNIGQSRSLNKLWQLHHMFTFE
jgi:hypothetical protein